MGIGLYSIVQINHSQSIISDQNSSIDQIFKARGDIEWWNSFGNTQLIPITAILVFAGTALLFFVVAKEKNWKLSDFIKIEIVESDEEDTLESID